MNRRDLLAALACLSPIPLPGFGPLPEFDPLTDRDPFARTVTSTDDPTAVVDRITDGTAVVIWDDADRQRTVPASVLPENAREEGVVLRIPDGDALALAEVDRAATREREAAARNRTDDLSERPP